MRMEQALLNIIYEQTKYDKKCFIGIFSIQ